MKSVLLSVGCQFSLVLSVDRRLGNPGRRWTRPSSLIKSPPAQTATNHEISSEFSPRHLQLIETRVHVGQIQSSSIKRAARSFQYIPGAISFSGAKTADRDKRWFEREKRGELKGKARQRSGKRKTNTNTKEGEAKTDKLVSLLRL